MRRAGGHRRCGGDGLPHSLSLFLWIIRTPSPPEPATAPAARSVAAAPGSARITRAGAVASLHPPAACPFRRPPAPPIFSPASRSCSNHRSQLRGPGSPSKSAARPRGLPRWPDRKTIHAWRRRRPYPELSFDAYMPVCPVFLFGFQPLC